jgi:peroxiredoxin Q/BCP
MLEVGDEAPDFDLPSTLGQMRLRDLVAASKVVLAFYNEDSTPLCTNQIAMLREDHHITQELGATVLGVSADTLDSHGQFVERLGGLPFALASDTDLEVARMYEVVDDDGKRSRRAVFVIDRGGTILHAERWFQPGNSAQYEAVFRALGFEG